jgi:hypothetical protein
MVHLSRRLVRHDGGAGRGEHPATPTAVRDLGARIWSKRCCISVTRVHAGVHVGKAAAIGVERQLAAGDGIALGYEGSDLAARHKAEIFEAIDRQMHHPLRLSRWNGQRSNSPDGPKSRVHFISRRLPMPQV